MAVDGEAAYVLHARAYRDTSLIVELLTRSKGRVDAVARGARGGKRQMATTLAPFNEVVVSCRGRGQLLTLTQVEMNQQHRLTGAALFSGLYLNELLLRFVRHDDPHPLLFDGYGYSLAALAEGAELEGVLRRFEKLALKESGYELVLSFDAESGEPIEPQQAYELVTDLGFRRVNHAVDERRVFSGATLAAIANDNYSDPTVRLAAKGIMRRAIAPHLGDKPLKSRSLFTPERFGSTAERGAEPE
jgi:DNA repair protein RecO (recombination protein O)